MADGVFASKVSATRDDNLVTNPIFVNLSDGTDGALIDGSGNLQVILAANDGVDIGNVDVTSVIPGVGATNLGKAEDAVHASGDTGVAILAVRNDTLASLVSADGDYAPIQVDADGAVYVTGDLQGADVQVDDSAFTPGTDSVGVAGYFADETAPDSVDEGDIGAARMTLDRKQLFVLVDATTDSQRLAINASGEAQVDVAAHALTNANAVPISKDNNANAETNPLYVYQVNTVVSGSEIHDYDTSAAVASDTSDNHDYTASNTTFFLKSVIVAGSGNIKAEIQTGPIASLATDAVIFLNGKEGDTKQVVFDPAIEVTGVSPTVRVIRTNRQGSATDVYSTIIGNDV
jgi:hypothetical protein